MGANYREALLAVLLCTVPSCSASTSASGDSNMIPRGQNAQDEEPIVVGGVMPREPLSDANVRLVRECLQQKPRDSCTLAGVMLRDADPAFSVQLFRMGCNLIRPTRESEVDACSSAGMMLCDGNGLAKKDCANGATYLGVACDAAHKRACTYLGLMYLLGKDLPPDMRRGLSLLERGCALGDAKACALAEQLKRELGKR
jgi:hypothetical protein